VAKLMPASSAQKVAFHAKWANDFGEFYEIGSLDA